MPSQLARIRKLCLSLPESSEKLSWGAPNFRVRERVFAMYAAANNHHGDGRESVWLNCDVVSQQFMIQREPKRYFKPAYVGAYGWVGVYLDARPNWKVVADRVTEAHEYTLARLAAKKAEAKAKSRKPKTASRKK